MSSSSSTSASSAPSSSSSKSTQSLGSPGNNSLMNKQPFVAQQPPTTTVQKNQPPPAKTVQPPPGPAYAVAVGNHQNSLGNLSIQLPNNGDNSAPSVIEKKYNIFACKDGFRVAEMWMHVNVNRCNVHVCLSLFVGSYRLRSWAILTSQAVWLPVQLLLRTALQTLCQSVHLRHHRYCIPRSHSLVSSIMHRHAVHITLQWTLYPSFYLLTIQLSLDHQALAPSKASTVALVQRPPPFLPTSHLLRRRRHSAYSNNNSSSSNNQRWSPLSLLTNLYRCPQPHNSNQVQ